MRSKRNNAAVKHSLKLGRRIGEYLGEPPQFVVDPQTHTVIKIAKGIPFVRAERASM